MYLLAVISSFACLARSQTCYWPNGDLAQNNYPCTPSDAASFCCQVGSVCSTNQLCVDEYGTYRRGSCTDATWKSASCPNFCTTEVNATHTDNGGYDDLTECGNSTSNDFIACCGDPGNYYNCDCNNTPHITLPAFAAFTTISLPSGTTATSSGTSASSSTTESSLAASSSANQTASSNIGVPASTAGSTSASSPHTSSALSSGAMAGIGVGAVLVALIIALLAFFLWRSRRQLKQSNPEPKVEPDPSPLPHKPELAGSGTASARQWSGIAGQRHELQGGTTAVHEIGMSKGLKS